MSSLLKLSFIICLFFTTNVFAQATKGSLTVNITKFENDKGQVIVNLFQEGSNVMKIETVFKRIHSKITNKQATVVFDDIPYGKYAISVFHDVNNNDDLDHNFLGFPGEPLGFSNGFHLGLFSGLPSFEKLQFIFEPGANNVSIAF